MVPSQAPKRELSRKAWSWRNAERNTSWTRSSTSGGGTRARRMPWTIRAYRAYRRPNATRSPSRAAETSESCSRDSVTGQTVTDVKFHVCGSNVNPVSHVKPLSAHVPYRSKTRGKMEVLTAALAARVVSGAYSLNCQCLSPRSSQILPT